MPTQLLVTGASGHLGRRVVELLLEAGEEHIIATTRTPDKLADFAARGVTVRYASFDEADSMVAAFTGADRVLLISTDALDRREKQQEDAVQAAVTAGVKHVVYTSIIAADDTPVTLAHSHASTEAALASSGIGYTVLRNNIYADTIIGMLAQARSAGGRLISATGDGKMAYVTREDCARVASAALASSFDGQRTLDVTGPEALSRSEIAEIATALGSQTFTHIPVSSGELLDVMIKAGLPQFVAEMLVSMDVATAQGKFSGVTSTIEDLTGRKPVRVADFLAEHAQAFSV